MLSDMNRPKKFEKTYGTELWKLLDQMNANLAQRPNMLEVVGKL